MTDQKTIMREMLANAVHFGQKTSKWNPKMAPFLYDKRNGVHIFDLNQTYQGLIAAMDFLKDAASRGENILFVSTKQQSKALIQEAAEKCGMPFVNSKWIPGLLTNFNTIKTRIKYLQKLKDEQESGEFDKYTKKEAQNLKKQIEKLETALGGVANLEKPPRVIFVADVVRDKIAVQEALKIGATVVAIVDSNANPDGIQYLIPGNDDAVKSLTYLVTKVSEAVQEGSKGKKK
jgi:small subunit ribosomal protein S2